MNINRGLNGKVCSLRVKDFNKILKELPEDAYFVVSDGDHSYRFALLEKTTAAVYDLNYNGDGQMELFPKKKQLVLNENFGESNPTEGLVKIIPVILVF